MRHNFLWTLKQVSIRTLLFNKKDIHIYSKGTLPNTLSIFSHCFIRAQEDKEETTTTTTPILPPSQKAQFGSQS
jgi:hypothetical protein